MCVNVHVCECTCMSLSYKHMPPFHTNTSPLLLYNPTCSPLFSHPGPCYQSSRGPNTPPKQQWCWTTCYNHHVEQQLAPSCVVLYGGWCFKTAPARQRCVCVGGDGCEGCVGELCGVYIVWNVFIMHTGQPLWSTTTVNHHGQNSMNMRSKLHQHAVKCIMVKIIMVKCIMVKIIMVKVQSNHWSNKTGFYRWWTWPRGSRHGLHG